MWSNVKTFKLTFQMCHSCVKDVITNDTAPQHSSLGGYIILHKTSLYNSQ